MKFSDSGFFVLGGTCELFRIRLRSLRRFAEETEAFIKREIRRLERQFRREAKSIPKEQSQDLGEWYGEQINELVDEFPSILRTSIFVMQYALLETFLSDLCQHLQRAGDLSLSLGDLRDRGVQRASTYLTKVVHVSFPNQSPEWRCILHLNRIRNLVVHSGGRAAGKDRKLTAAIKAISGIELDRYGRIGLKSEVIPWTSDLLHRFSETLQERVIATINAHS